MEQEYSYLALTRDKPNKPGWSVSGHDMSQTEYDRLKRDGFTDFIKLAKETGRDTKIIQFITISVHIKTTVEIDYAS